MADAIATGLEIAVIGMAVRFPGAKDTCEFWNNLKNSKESITFFSTEELEEVGAERELLEDPNYVKAHGMLEGIEYFDSMFFGYTPREAEIMDPQTRVFHECVWTALEDAGYETGSYDGLISLYAGSTPNLYWSGRAILSGKSNDFGVFAARHLMQKDYLTLRISYKLDLMGPSYSLYTACSTSLVAIHVACQAILGGDCDLALAGGVTVAKYTKSGYMYQEGMVLSPDGHCRPFDASAKGFVCGDGSGVVVLKRLEEAVAEGDHIYAVIKGSAINNDGLRKAGFSASSVEGQAEVINMAFHMAEVEPESVRYIETHGTATILGDPVEIEGLRLAFKTNKKGFCGIGSVKSNMGHLDSAAGAAGFIKTVLALKHKLIPKSLHFEIPNPQLDFINSPFYVVTKPSEWNNENGNYPLRAGVSSFGIGGTNAHVILEEWPENRTQDTGNITQDTNHREYHLILLSAKTGAALGQMTQNLANHFKKNPALHLADAAYTLQIGRKAFKHRWMAVCATAAETLEALTSPGGGETYQVSPEEESFDLEKAKPVVDKHSLTRIGRSWLQGHNIDWKGLYSRDKRRRVSLPTYPFERQRYWIEDEAVATAVESLNENAPLSSQQNMSGWFYLPTWKQTVPDSSKNNAFSLKSHWRWLVFVNELPLGELLAKHLRERGADVVVVKMGDAFDRLDDGVYVVNPRQSHDYDSLLEQLRAENALPDKIVHCWNVTSNEHHGMTLNRDIYDAAQYLGFYSLLYLAKTLGKQTFSHGLHIALLSNHVQDVIGEELLQPEKAAVLGLLKSIPQEYPGIRCTTIDLELPPPDSRGEKKSEYIQSLLEELIADPVDLVVAYRKNRRWVQIFDPLPLEKPEKEQLGLKKKGVYLITGGLGNIGLMFSELFVKRVNARLVLTGRSSFPAKHEWAQWLETHGESDPISLKIKKLQELEKMGGEILYLQANAANPEQMRCAVSKAEETFGSINGIIHGAGIIEGKSKQTIQNLSHDDCQLQFQAKVYGTMILEDLFKDKKLDFCWMLSSISCVLGGLGFGAYAAANMFMDFFVKQHNRRTGSQWFSLDWDGMEVDKSIAIFERMFPLKKIDQLVVSHGGNLYDRIERWIRLENLNKKKPTAIKTTSSLYPRPELSVSYAAPRNTNEENIANIWQGVLGYGEIGVRDDFLELGGDSLKAITVISRIHQELNVNITVTEFFTTPTIEGIAQCISSHENEGAYVSINPVEKKEFYPLAMAQKRLYIMQQMEMESTSYNMPYILEIEGNYDKNRVEDTFRKLIKRHEGFRTSFEIIGHQPVQKIHPEVGFQIQALVLDQENHQGNPTPQSIKEIMKNFMRPFDLTQAPLLRVGLIKLGQENHILLIDMHHIISDGISLGIIIKDFEVFYEGKELPLLKIQNKDLAHWQNLEEIKEKIKKQEEFWVKQFQAELPVLSLPIDYPRPAKQTFKGERYNFEIDENLTKGLKELALDESVTLFMIMLALYNIWLSKLTGSEDIVVGTGVDIRKDENQQQIIGMFINTLALRNYPQRKKFFKEFLKEVNQGALMAFENNDYPFEELVEKVLPKRNLNQNPLFDTFIMSQDMNIALPGMLQDVKRTGLGLKLHGYENPISKFDVFLYYKDEGNKIFFSLEYRTELFNRDTIERFINYFKDIVAIVVEDTNIQLENIKICHNLFVSKDKFSQEEYDFNF